MGEIYSQRNGSCAEESLCVTCANGQVVQGFVEGHHITRCYRGFRTWEVPFPVRKCTDYKSRHQPSLDDMKEVAHVLVRGQRGKQVGFVTPDQYRELQEQEQD